MDVLAGVVVPIIVAVIAATPPTLAVLSTRRKVEAIDQAVNNRPAEAPTLSQDVADIRADVARIAPHFAEPPPGASHQTLPTRVSTLERRADGHDRAIERLHDRIDDHLERPR